MKKTINKDTMKHVEESNLIQLSRELLSSIVDSTKILDLKEMTPDKLKESKVVLGFLNAADRAMKTKMTYFKMTGVGDKVSAVKHRSKKF